MVDVAKMESGTEPIFSDSRDSITGAMSSYDSSSNDDEVEGWNEGVARRIQTSLENLINTFRWLQENNGCCDVSTILTKTDRNDDLTSLKQVPLSSLQALLAALNEYREASSPKPCTSQLLQVCQDTVSQWGRTETFAHYISEGKGTTARAVCCLHLAALIVQFASLGIVTYWRGHSRPFEHPCLSRDVVTFLLSGADCNGPNILVERVALGFPGAGYIDGGRPVWIFAPLDTASPKIETKPYLKTTLEDLLGLWGGQVNVHGLCAAGKGRLISYQLGKGSISAATDPGKTNGAYPRNDTVCCQWQEGHDAIPFELRPDQKLVISAALVDKVAV